MSNTNDISYAIKDGIGHYFIGYGKWDKQLRKAKLYHSYKFAEEIRDDARFADRNAKIVKVKIVEIEEVNNDETLCSKR